MKFVEQVQSELKKAVLQHQTDLILQVLRRRSGELTFGDLRALLTHPLGRGLTEVRAAEIFADAATSLPTGSGKQSNEKPPGQPQPRGAGKKTRKSVSGRRAAKPRDAAKSSRVATRDLTTAVLTILQSAKAPLSSSQIATEVKVRRGTALTILQTLSDAKRIVVSGSSRFTRYALAPSRPGAQSDDGFGRAPRKVAEPDGRRPQSAAQSTRSAADRDAAALAEFWSGMGATQAPVPREKPASPERRAQKSAAEQPAQPMSQPQHGASPSVVESVSAALLAAQQPLSTSELVERVKAHPISVRRVLIALIDAGRVVTEGPATQLRYQLVASAAHTTSPPASNAADA